jgi:hypothetical protein
MAHQHFDEESSKKYTLTLFISFAVVFVFVVLMMLWQGDFHPGGKSYTRVYDGPSSGKPVQIEKEALKENTPNTKE